MDNTTLVDQATWAAEQAGYYFKYQNAPLTYSFTWPDPSQLRLARLPKTADGVGGTVFWDTGAVLFKYGNNKPKMVEFIQAIQKDDAIWQNSVQGDPDAGTSAVGQLPVTQSNWADWEASPPDYVTANPWVFEVRDALADASAIAPSLLSISQFDVARPIWQKYLYRRHRRCQDGRPGGVRRRARRVQEADRQRPAGLARHSGPGGADRSTGFLCYRRARPAPRARAYRSTQGILAIRASQDDRSQE